MDSYLKIPLLIIITAGTALGIPLAILYSDAQIHEKYWEQDMLNHINNTECNWLKDSHLYKKYYESQQEMWFMQNQKFYDALEKRGIECGIIEEKQ